jgi:hypothetical protein
LLTIAIPFQNHTLKIPDAFGRDVLQVSALGYVVNERDHELPIPCLRIKRISGHSRFLEPPLLRMLLFTKRAANKAQPAVVMDQP